ncbi:hypothetical protein [Dyella terrae]|uniref:hypothetical protein n=1 Tax=Dyella terrae TaxID=522259 RepID=UPI001EFC34F7|nr:hypothetical protein [Dyella terrae]ULU26626.1 hypothetical protein DYST_03572 [Dyella terrae]
MSSVARHIIKGAPAWLIVRQAKKVAECSGRTIYQLDNDPLMLGVHDSRAETLVVFDAAGLVALATSEVTHRSQVERTGGIDVQA